MESSYNLLLVTGALLIIVFALAMIGGSLERKLRRLRASAQASEEELRRNEARFRSLVQRSSDVILILDTDSTICFASPAMERVFGHDVQELEGGRLLDLLHPDDHRGAATYCLRIASEENELPTSVWRIRHRDGTWRHVESAGARLTTEEEGANRIVLNCRDITDRVRLEAELTHQAFHDALTGLANRALFRDRVEHALERSGRSAGGTTVLFIDLNDFKTVNDSLGHAAGDRLLGAVAQRLLNASRGCDTAARLGGDEFGILLENVGPIENAITVAERVLAVFHVPFIVEGSEVRISASLGIARATATDGPEDLLRNADLAMYRAKQKSSGGFELFDPEMHAEILNRLELEIDLRRALEQSSDEPSQFRLDYQPIVDLGSGAVIGVEALVRWDHPRRGTVPPLSFIPIAEKTGLILPLGRWILLEACREVVSWDTTAAITVNVSGHQLQHAEFVGEVSEALRSSGLPAERLVLEVTESVVMGDTDAIIAALAELRRFGVRIAIDDFGTGYSSLSYLQRFPVDILKIDKTFVDRVAVGGQAAALTRMIIGLGDMLSLRLVAEGIEQADQQMHLKALGCGYGQGYYFARPMAGVAAAALVRSGATCPLPGLTPGHAAAQS